MVNLEHFSFAYAIFDLDLQHSLIGFRTEDRDMPNRRQFHLRVLGLGASCLGLPALTLAQDSDYPNRPIKIVVPFAAGGGPDVLTRKMALKLAEVLGKGSVVVVDNIVGAGGILAAQSVARMAPDGYNLLLGASSHLVQKAMEPGLKFDPMKDFAHITRTTFSPSILVVSATSTYLTVEDLVAAAKSKPGQLNYASGGVGSAAHLSAAALVLQAKIDAVHVPYKGSVEIVPSIIAGDTQFAFPIASTAIPQIQGGRVRALAVTSAQRMPGLPNVPTLVEVFKTQDLALESWFGLWAPAGTPPKVVDILFKAVVQAYGDPPLRADSEAAGAVVALSSSPAEFTKFMAVETVKLDKLVKAANLSVRT
jgi:tripartite-type tricarboxylate transporter receptor subunit TctC